MPAEKTDLQTRAFRDAEAFRTWLHDEHERSEGLWLKIAKKGSDVRSVTYAEAVDVALSYGWIDGQKARYDETWFLQRFTPRRPRSVWSQINCDKATRLIDEGLMQPAGLDQVERAKADGRWDAAYQGSRTMTVPDDLQAALDANPAASAAFAAISRTNRYAFLYRIHEAKRPQTRAARIATFIDMLAKGETLH
ncbi:MAG: YdeI/OmpD-associated family protein [Acidimicrobiales bacterium]